ncbi:MAG: hypothetical protein VKI42_08155 [Synechococcaceae cyanobacterium]|nr:hypothetical protein [Synechococcaceae cyanobacterium]
MIRQVLRRAVAPCALALLIVVRPAPAASLSATARPTPRPADLDVCVIVPRLAEGNGPTIVPLSRPTLFTAGPLLQIRIEREGRLAWHLDAPTDGLIQGPIAWPLAPIRPGEPLRLLLRPPGAAADAFAVVPIQGASAAVLQRNEALVATLGQDPAAWLRAVLQQRDRGDLVLALALLFAFEGPSSRELDSLRLEVFRRGCGGSAAAAELLRPLPLSQKPSLPLSLPLSL